MSTLPEDATLKPESTSDPPSGSPAIDGFSELTFLGAGATGSVYCGKRLSDNRQFALKVVQVNSTEKVDRIFREAQSSGHIKANHLVTCIDALPVSDNRSALVMEFCPHGTLQQFIASAKEKNERLPEDRVQKILSDILDGLNDIHLCAVLHGNLNPREILFSEDWSAKISHLGSRVALEHEATEKLYLAPEVLDQRFIDEQCDIWSIGVLAYELCTLRPPFLTTKGILNHSRIEDLPMEDVYPSIAELIGRCLQNNRLMRPSSEDLIRSPLFTGA